MIMRQRFTPSLLQSEARGVNDVHRVHPIDAFCEEASQIELLCAQAHLSEVANNCSKASVGINVSE
jgi:hypothetical protein